VPPASRSRLIVRIHLAPFLSPRRREQFDEVHEIALSATLRDFKGHRRRPCFGSFGAIREILSVSKFGGGLWRSRRRLVLGPESHIAILSRGMIGPIPVFASRTGLATVCVCQAGDWKPSMWRWASHARGSSVRSFSNDSAVRFGGWQPLTICSTISGARKARRIIRLT
jgi:hypothetical protein